MGFSTIILTPTVVFMVIGTQVPVQAAVTLPKCESVGGQCMASVGGYWSNTAGNRCNGRVDETSVCSGPYQICCIEGGYCKVRRDPHIHTYDSHNLTNGPNPMVNYSTGFNTGEFVLSRTMLEEVEPVTEQFGVYANFTRDFKRRGVTYASAFNYYQPGIEVVLILPLYIFNGMADHCQGNDLDTPQCETKILVNREELRIVANGLPVELNGTDGTVLIFKYGYCSTNYGSSASTCTILVVGSKGFVLRLDVEHYSDEYYNLFIFPALHLQNKLYGLCGTFTGESTPHYTLQNGTEITNIDNMDQFVQSWKNYGNFFGKKYQERDSDSDGVTNDKDICPNDPNIHTADFTEFQSRTLDGKLEGQHQIDFEITDGGTGVTQIYNSKPGLMFGTQHTLFGLDFDGSFIIDDDSDDDFVGFIFGYKDTSSFYVAMWKKDSQGDFECGNSIAQAGVQLKRVHSMTGPSCELQDALWSSTSVHDQVSVIWRDHNEVGWKPHTHYDWELTHRPKTGLIRVKFIEKETSIVIADSGDQYDNEIKGGKIGLYCHSQEGITWSNLSYRCNDDIPTPTSPLTGVKRSPRYPVRSG